MRKYLSVIALIAILCLSLTGCGKNEESETEVKNALPQLSSPSYGDTIVTISTSQGDIKAVLYTAQAPENVANFVALATAGYYDGVLIHKAIADFCIQAGDPTLKGDGGESSTGRGIEQEYSDLLHNFTGAIGMASGADDLNRSQFYIVAGGEVTDEYVSAMTAGGYSQEVINAYTENGGQPSLDYNYTVIGQVYSGLDLVKELSNVKTDEYNRPQKDIEIESVTVSTYGSEE